MKASIQHINSPDIDIRTYDPKGDDSFGFYLEVTIGPEGGDSEEIFGMQVCTPGWLASHHAMNSVIFGRHLIIVFEFNMERIEECIREYVEGCSADNWDDITTLLRRIGKSEFEDYKPWKGK